MFPWDNVDVNCDGDVGDEITGLNERYLPGDVEYASLFDTFDLVVTQEGTPFNTANISWGGEDFATLLTNSISISTVCPKHTIARVGAGMSQSLIQLMLQEDIQTLLLNM